MAISLNSDGLHLNYPTYVCTSAVSVPVGCAVCYQNSTGSSYGLVGTWAMHYHSGYVPYFELTSNMNGGTNSSGIATYASFAIRVA